jgi:hypothetical protein
MATTKRTLMAAVAIIGGSMCGGWLAQHAGQASAAEQIPAGYIALNPGRIYDSRGPSFTNPPLAGGAQVTIDSGHPGASAVGVNIVLTETAGAGFLTAWPAGTRPGTSVMNSSAAGETVANFVLVPVAPDGTFQLYTQNPTHVVVDIMGYMAGGSALVPAGFSGQVTGYSLGATKTTVAGEVTNGTSDTVNLRALVQCGVGAAAEIAYIFDVPAGGVRGWTVACDGFFISGATVTVVQI